jgi:hypothetical protein
VKFDVPAAAGVPEITPVRLSRNMPAGSDPVGTDHVKGPMPETAETARL